MTRGRVAAGFLLTVMLLPALTVVAHAAGLELADGVLLFLAVVVGVALLGGLWPALLAAVGGFLLLNYFFTAPVRSLDVNTGQGALALAVFVLIALSVSWIVDLAARRLRRADAAAAEAHVLAAVAGGVLAGPDPLAGLLSELRELFGLSSVSLREGTPDGPRLVARIPDKSDSRETSDLAAGTATTSPAHPGAMDPSGSASRAAARPQTATSPQTAPGPLDTRAGETVLPLAEDGLVLVLEGRELDANEQRIAAAFGAQAAVALRQQRLTTAAEGDRVRSALLTAVSHDLRTPLAAAKAAVGSLRSDDVHFDEDDRRELLETADVSLDRLAALLANLLDMSRLRAGALAVHPVDIDLEDVVSPVLDELGCEVPVQLSGDAVRADPGLLQRVLVNVVGNALRYGPVEITAAAAGEHVELRVVDHGPGIAAGDRDRVFQAFQRLGDHDNHTGVGLGLALSRGLTEAMSGTLTPEDTPGGGLTMVLRLPKGTS
ncbi:hypothetical protein Aab01nite_04340 [Paractinoplanes abujensis]|uniref:histidine kinase n=1 Tax=Paractinoplanes abujensis TaxID=882441 RepID=A0A7W7G0M5_9ACTN|nr:ATP-binding protein [Actinoplanes abujensis]MBB4691734.1 two-component system sensor histidine kinase KdpD [Actinoplanes abujensis]GID16844.1 hypothetical protein Aab01nite_04340 [Actinoplanes abujensis]